MRGTFLTGLCICRYSERIRGARFSGPATVVRRPANVGGKIGTFSQADDQEWCRMQGKGELRKNRMITAMRSCWKHSCRITNRGQRRQVPGKREFCSRERVAHWTADPEPTGGVVGSCVGKGKTFGPSWGDGPHRNCRSSSDHTSLSVDSRPYFSIFRRSRGLEILSIRAAWFLFHSADLRVCSISFSSTCSKETPPSGMSITSW